MNEQNDNDTQLEIMPPSASLAIERAAIDSQISTAKAYPRSLQVFKKRAIDMACLDEETAESCLYRRPVGGGKFAEGMSVRMSEIVGASYGNLRVQATIVEQTERFVRARGMAIDLESNYASSSECIESTVKKDGTPYDERMRVVIAKSALSKARRDAMFQVVPRALAKPVENAVRSLLLGDTKTIEARRQLVVQWITKTGIGSERIYAALGIKGEADLGVEQLETLTGIRTALKENEITLDEAFPVIGEPVKRAEPKPRAKTGAAAVQENVAKPTEPAKTDAPKTGQTVEGELMPGDPAAASAPAEQPKQAAQPTYQEKVAEALARSSLNPAEVATFNVEVAALETLEKSASDKTPVLRLGLKGQYEGEVLGFGTQFAALAVGDTDPVAVPLYAVGARLKITLHGFQIKPGKVQVRIEQAEPITAKKTLNDD